MTRCARTLPLALLFAVVPGYAAGLPDTGQDTCYTNSAADGVPAGNPASIARDKGTFPRQDCRYGRDAAAVAGTLTKVGAGAKGFDYTKIANNGTALDVTGVLGTGPTEWACTKDNITGLTWEIKQIFMISGQIRDQDFTYTWFSTDASSNGGDSGSTGGNTCNGTLPSLQCNTRAFVAAVNGIALCTYTDWRLPTRRELQSLVYAGALKPSIDPTYFPNTVAQVFWSGSSDVQDPSDAWSVDFSAGTTFADSKALSHHYLRLVRGGEF